MKVLFISIFLLTLSYSAHSRADIAVIVNNDNDISALTLSELKRIYTGKVSQFSNGVPIHLSDLSKKDPIRDSFYKRATGKSTKKMIAYWRERLFSGEGIPPKENRSAARMKFWVSDQQGAIGYVDASEIDTSVKTVLVIKQP